MIGGEGMKDVMFLSISILCLSLALRIWWLRVAVTHGGTQNIYHHNKPKGKDE